jgi:hypothetical protein
MMSAAFWFVASPVALLCAAWMIREAARYPATYYGGLALVMGVVGGSVALMGFGHAVVLLTER